MRANFYFTSCFISNLSGQINIWFEMFAIALGMSPIEKITVTVSASIFIIAFTWVSIKGDLRKLANELIEDNENNEDN